MGTNQKRFNWEPEKVPSGGTSLRGALWGAELRGFQEGFQWEGFQWEGFQNETLKARNGKGFKTKPFPH